MILKPYRVDLSHLKGGKSNIQVYGKGHRDSIRRALVKCGISGLPKGWLNSKVKLNK